MLNELTDDTLEQINGGRSRQVTHFEAFTCDVAGGLSGIAAGIVGAGIGPVAAGMAATFVGNAVKQGCLATIGESFGGGGSGGYGGSGGSYGGSGGSGSGGGGGGGHGGHPPDIQAY